MPAARYDVLFLCTGNTARSIIAESVMTRDGADRFRAFSAGSHPSGKVHPLALDLLERHGFPTDSLRSKSWDEFAEPGAPQFDFVFTVCDRAAREACPIWPGRPITAHWGMPDPAACIGSDIDKHLAFAETLRVLKNRIDLLLSLPMASLDKMSLRKRLDEIGGGR